MFDFPHTVTVDANLSVSSFPVCCFNFPRLIHFTCYQAKLKIKEKKLWWLLANPKLLDDWFLCHLHWAEVLPILSRYRTACTPLATRSPAGLPSFPSPVHFCVGLTKCTAKNACRVNPSMLIELKSQGIQWRLRHHCKSGSSTSLVFQLQLNYRRDFDRLYLQ